MAFTDQEWIKMINDVGRSSSPSFKFVAFHGRRGTQRVVEVVSKDGRTKVTSANSIRQNSMNPFNVKKKTDKEWIDLINSQGAKASPSFKFLNFSGRNRANQLLVEIISESGEVKVVNSSGIQRGSNPFYKLELPENDWINLINRKGKKSRPSFSFNKFIGMKGRHRYVEVICEDGRRASARISSIKSGQSPFNREYSLKYWEDLVNKIGSKVSPSYKFKGIGKKIESSNKTIDIECEDGRIKNNINSTSFKKGFNPFYKRGIPEEKWIKIINKVGKTSIPRFEFVEFLDKKKRSTYVAKVKSEDGRITTSLVSSIKNGHNPFILRSYEYCKKEALKYKTKTEFQVKSRSAYLKVLASKWLELLSHMPEYSNQDRREHKVVHPKISKILSKYRSLKVYKEKTISRRSRPDFILENKYGRILVIEAKSDKSDWKKKDLEFQKKKYSEDSKKVFGKNYFKIVFVSEKGLSFECISLSKFRIILNKFKDKR